MKVTRAEAQANHERVLESASQLFRQWGFDGVSVNALMQSAGLTRGGFYGHFESKQQLVIQSLELMLEENDLQWQLLAKQGLPSLVNYYLSPDHRDTPQQGCMLAALNADVSRQQPAVKGLFNSGVGNLMALLASCAPGGTEQEQKNKATVWLCILVGALSLSRAVADEQLADYICQQAIGSILQSKE